MNRFFWKLPKDIDQEPAKSLAGALNIPQAGARFLVSRSYSTADEAKAYLFPSESVAKDPFTFENMERAVSLIDRALREQKKILIHGDYDVDGISGTAILYLFFKGLAVEVLRFLPDRRKDGYGLSERAVKWAIENNVGLLIAVDCGTSDGDLVKEARSHGIDVVICDHHAPPADKTVEGVVLNPIREGESYPFKHLCGTGVAFKLVQGLEKSGLGGDQKAEDFLDLLALATVGDLAPLVDENRHYVQLGLGKINQMSRPGLRAIRDCARIQGREITARHLAFVVVPRLNAPGRVSNAKPSLEILCTDDEVKAQKLALVLERENERRRELTDVVRLDVEDMIANMPDSDERAGYILASKEWDEGVLGIAAARIVETLGKPAILMSLMGGVAKGSGRSISGVNLKEQLDKCRKHLIRYGGHAQAVGLTIETARIPDFEKDLAACLREATGGMPSQPILQIDADISIEECTLELIEFLRMCGPFGAGNRAPVWRIRGSQVDSGTGFVGNGHLKLFFHNSNGRSADAIGFNWNRPFGPSELYGKTVDLAVTIDKGSYMDQVYPEIRIIDIKHHTEGET